jgi:hypothetical protein
MNINISIQHIKGHSDSKKPYEKLTLLQQLNVDADELADQYIQANMDKDYRWATLLPSSGVNLNMETGTITHDMKRAVKEARILEKQSMYLCKKNNWDSETFETIAWEPHRRAINRHNKKKVTMVKYLNGIIPVGKRVSRYDKKYSAQCPSCEELMETQEHLHKCLNPTREQWRNTFKETIKKVMQKYNSPYPMVQLWLAGITKGIEEDDNHMMQHEYDATLEAVKEAQKRIGWNQLLQGRMAKEWIVIQREAMGDKATKRKNAVTWATDIISTTFEQWLNLWKLRNEDRHGKDNKTRKEAERRQAIRELEQMYEDNEDVNTGEEWILHRPLEVQRTKSTYTIRAMISNYAPVLEGSHQTQLETG